MPAVRLDLATARRLWARRQQLGLGQDPATCPGGWLRALGGIHPYVALRARCPGTTRAQVDRLVAASQIVPTPGVRGCMWIVPREDAALAIVVGDAASRGRMLRELQKLDVTERELDEVKAAAIEALAQGPFTPRELADAIPDGVVRSLGEAGKKVGISTTLPSALRLLEADGRVRRVAPDHRIDTERWLWGVAPSGWLDVSAVPDDPVEQAAALAARFLSWSAPATFDALVAWTKLGKTHLTKAVERIGALPIEVEGLGDALVLPGQLNETLVDDDRVFLVDSLDNLITLRERPAPLVDPAFHDVEVRAMNGKRMQPIADATWADLRAIVHRGAVIGQWDWDPDTAEIVLAPFGTLTPALRRRTEAAAADLAPLIRDELDGVARSSTLDSPKQQRERVAWVRAQADA